MKKSRLILMMVIVILGEPSFGAAHAEEDRDRLGRVAAMRLALPDAGLHRGIKRENSNLEESEKSSPLALKRARNAPGSGGRRKEKRPKKSPENLQDALNLFSELKKEGSPKKEKFLEQGEGLPPSDPEPKKDLKRNLSGELM